VAALTDLERRLRALESTRGKLETLHTRQMIARRDLERVYDGLYISAVTSFEDFFEARFYQVMLQPAARRPEVVPRTEFKSSAVLREFVLGGRNFVNWLPFERTEQRAKVYLRGGMPFTVVDAGDKRRMKNWMIVRNAIAHTSREAKRRFEREILAGVPLPPRERTPAGYLRSQPRPSASRFQTIVLEMLGIAAKLH